MEQVGVQAVVQGLAAFMGDMRQVNSALDGLRPSGTLLQRMFEGLSDAVLGFGSHILNVVETALGVLLRDAFNFLIGQIKDLIGAIIEAGSEFQILQLRLERLNFNTLIESGMDMNEATKESIRLTQEQLGWIQRLAVMTPYDAQDVANTFTLARSYGFTADQAKRLTGNILDFTAGMGLTGQEMERIIINFGQLMQQGKLNGQELRDLARGAFVPVNDILKRMSKNMGITVDDLNKMRASGEGGAEMVTQFMGAFNELVEERFVGAAEKMATTFKGATANVVDLFKNILGMGVAKPILDVIGTKLQEFVTAFTNVPGGIDSIIAKAGELGAAFAGIFEALFGMLPSNEAIVEAVLQGFGKITDWVTENKDEIVQFFLDMGARIGEVVVWVRDSLIPFFQRIADWVTENKDTIIEFFTTLGEIVGEFITDLFGGRPEGEGDFLGGVLDGIKKFMEFVIENKDQIVKWIEVFWTILIVTQVIATAFNILIGIVGTLIGIILTVIGVFTTVSLVIALLSNPISWIVIALVGFGVAMAGIAVLALKYWEQIKAGAMNLWAGLVSVFNSIVSSVTTLLGRIWTSITTIDWISLGKSIIAGIASGITFGASSLISSAVSAAASAYSAVTRYLGIHSPSTLFAEVGKETMLGMAQGIEQFAGLATSSMVDAMHKVAMPAMTSPTLIQSIVGSGKSDTVNNTSNRNFNLTVNSGANTEPILQDFEMMQSLAG
jgi:tape measure domain-containing protein